MEGGSTFTIGKGFGQMLRSGGGSLDPEAGFPEATAVGVYGERNENRRVPQNRVGARGDHGGVRRRVAVARWRLLRPQREHGKPAPPQHRRTVARVQKDSSQRDAESGSLAGREWLGEGTPRLDSVLGIVLRKNSHRSPDRKAISLWTSMSSGRITSRNSTNTNNRGTAPRN